MTPVQAGTDSAATVAGSPDEDVVRVGERPFAQLAAALAHYGLRLQRVADGAPIPGSYWGECEAGLLGTALLVRDDTPLHSLLHEACHFICMTPARRARLHTDAGGDDLEESAVCYLQAVLADRLPDYGRQRLWRDMDRWGYSFRLGSARAWFESDAADARRWLHGHGVLDRDDRPTGGLRGAPGT